MWSRYREQSMTSDELTVCPHCDVPPPRGSTLTPSSRAIATAYSASLATGCHHAERRHLIMRRVGGVAAAAEGIEQHLAEKLRFQPAFEARAE